MLRPPPTSPLFPYTTLFRSQLLGGLVHVLVQALERLALGRLVLLLFLLLQLGQLVLLLLEAALGVLALLVVLGLVALLLELARSEEHTSELQSLRHLVCRLL